MAKAQITIALDIPDVRVLQTSPNERGEIIISIESTKTGTQCRKCGKWITKLHGRDEWVTVRHFFGDSLKPCTCAPVVVTKYQKRISGPLLDRIDIHIEVPRVDYEKLSGNKLSETSEAIRQRVQATRNIQQTRFTNPREASRLSKKGSSTDIISNADMRIGEIRQFCQLQDEGQSLMRAAMSQLQLSARAYHRILKLSRTIADLAGSDAIQSTHLAEALQYRPKLMIG